MGVRERIANQEKELELPANVERVGVDIDRRPVDVFDYKIWLSVGGAGVEQPRDAVVTEPGEYLPLPEKPIAKRRTFRIVADDFDGDGARSTSPSVRCAR